MRPLVPAVAAALAVAVAGAPACTSSTRGDGADGGTAVRVVATTTELADFARVVGGEHVAVYDVIKANVDPHDFEPSPADLDAIANADVVVENGVGLEAWFADTIASAEPRGAVVDASAGISLRLGDEDGSADPHIWHDPRNAKAMAATVEGALAAADPTHAPAYRANLDAYAAALDALDADIAAEVGALTNKRLVTNHDALGYYVQRYGLDYVGAVIPSFDTSAELSATQVATIVTRIRATGTKAVFSESALPSKTADAIGREAGVAVVAGEDALYGDSLGPPGSDADTYLKMMRHNTRVIVDNLR